MVQLGPSLDAVYLKVWAAQSAVGICVAATAHALLLCIMQLKERVYGWQHMSSCSVPSAICDSCERSLQVLLLLLRPLCRTVCLVVPKNNVCGAM